MAKRTFVKALALATALVAAPAVAQAQVLVSGTFTGGSNFATTMTGTLTALAGGLLKLEITNAGSDGEVFAAIGIINVPTGTLTPGAPAPAGSWNWEGTQQLGGDGLPESIWAWTAGAPAPQNGLANGESGTFYFQANGVSPLTNLGFGVHAISGPGGCSTKFGVWNGGRSDNDSGPGGYKSSCVSVPEPEGFALLATGLAGLAFVAVRRRNGFELVDEDGNQI